VAQLPDVTSVDRCGHFHLNAAHIVIAVWEHLLEHRRRSFDEGGSISALFEVQVNSLSFISSKRNLLGIVLGASACYTYRDR